MLKNKVTGWMLFASGILLQELSYMADIWIIRVLGRILWPVGMLMSINAMISRDQVNRSKEQESN